MQSWVMSQSELALHAVVRVVVDPSHLVAANGTQTLADRRQKIMYRATVALHPY